MTPTEERLAAIQARVEAAIKGPWVRSGHGFQVLTRPENPDESESVVELRLNFAPGRPDARKHDVQIATAEFIAHAREDIPWLMAEWQRSREFTQRWYAVRIERLRDLLKDTEYADAFFAVIANGDASRRLPDGSYYSEPPTYAQLLQRTLWRAERAEKEVERLRAELAQRGGG